MASVANNNHVHNHHLQPCHQQKTTARSDTDTLEQELSNHLTAMGLVAKQWPHNQPRLVGRVTQSRRERERGRTEGLPRQRRRRNGQRHRRGTRRRRGGGSSRRVSEAGAPELGRRSGRRPPHRRAGELGFAWVARAGAGGRGGCGESVEEGEGESGRRAAARGGAGIGRRRIILLW